MNKKYGLILAALLVLALALVACQPETVETVREVVVTRVVTETVVEEGETVEVTRVVTETETQEVVVEVTAVPEAGDEPVTLRWNWGAEPPSLDPAKAEDSVSIDAAFNINMGLTRPDPVTGEVLPDLATGWDISEDGTVYTFTMRDDVPWVNYDPNTGEFTQEVDEDGNPRFVTAHDVVYGVKRAADPETGSPYSYVLYLIVGAQEFNSGEEGVTADDVAVEALDDFTVQFTLKAPAPYFPSIAGLWPAYPQPQWAIEEWGPKWTEAGLIVTNGRYGVEEWIHGGTLNLVKNPLHPDADSVQIERVEGVMITEDSTAFAMYENNELDTQNPPLPELDRIKADPMLSEELEIAPAPSTYYYGFVNNKAPFDDVRVRKAFTQSIDRQSLIDNVLKGGQIPATSFAPPGIFGAPPPGEVGLPYDPEAAQASLQEYLNEQGISVEDFSAQGITLMHNTSEGHAAIAAAIQQMWKDVLGVDVNVENQEWKVYLQTLKNETPLAEMPHIYRLAWGADYPDENNWVHEVFNAEESENNPRRGCLDENCTQVEPQEFDNITKQAQLEQDPAVRTELYREAERLLTEEEVAIAPIYHYTTVNMTKPWLTRSWAGVGGDVFWTWTIDEAAQAEALGQ
jgi:oligopeptide transport system substrate-binding protein